MTHAFVYAICKECMLVAAALRTERGDHEQSVACTMIMKPPTVHTHLFPVAYGQYNIIFNIAATAYRLKNKMIKQL